MHTNCLPQTGTSSEKTQNKNKLTRYSSHVRTVHMTVHNCSTQYSTEQFQQFSTFSFRRSPQLRRLLKGKRHSI